jgi:hypothetical protein
MPSSPTVPSSNDSLPKFISRQALTAEIDAQKTTAKNLEKEIKELEKALEDKKFEKGVNLNLWQSARKGD